MDEFGSDIPDPRGVELRRPSAECVPHRLYDPAFLEPARQMVANGATVVELADHFGVAHASVELWAACHREFAEVLRVGKALADDRVERSWYNRCVGYTYDSEKVYNSGENGVGVVRVPIREHVPPDPAACAAWLRSRRPEQWNPRERVEHSGILSFAITRQDTQT